MQGQWEIASVYELTQEDYRHAHETRTMLANPVKQLLTEGWEPFAVVSDGKHKEIYFKRRSKEPVWPRMGPS